MFLEWLDHGWPDIDGSRTLDHDYFFVNEYSKPFDNAVRDIKNRYYSIGDLPWVTATLCRKTLERGDLAKIAQYLCLTKTVAEQHYVQVSRPERDKMGRLVRCYMSSSSDSHPDSMLQQHQTDQPTDESLSRQTDVPHSSSSSVASASTSYIYATERK